MELKVYNINGSETGRTINLDDSVFAMTPNDHAIYLDCKQYLANQRQGTHKSKERSEISGSTRKLGRQRRWRSTSRRHQLARARRRSKSFRPQAQRLPL
jgi:ribosomal protein L4